MANVSAIEQIIDKLNEAEAALKLLTEDSSVGVKKVRAAFGLVGAMFTEVRSEMRCLECADGRPVSKGRKKKEAVAEMIEADAPAVVPGDVI